MSLNTFFGDFNICETGLGTKIHNVSSPKLGRMFEEVVYTLFSTLLKYKSKWLTPWSGKNGAPVCHPQNIRKISTYGLRKMVEPQTLEIDIMNLKKNCHSKYEMYHGPVRQYLSPYAYQQISDMVDMDHYDLDIMLWTQIVYSMIYMFDKGDEKTKIDIVNALKPLYFARSISFDYKTSRYSVPFAEREVISQAMAFLSQKPYLLGLYMGNGKGR
jgi:hypothetical protein